MPSPVSGTNHVGSNGEIEHLFTVHGIAGEKTFITPYRNSYDGSSDGDGNGSGDGGNGVSNRLIFDVNKYTDNQICYLPEEVLSDYNSLKLWKPVKDAIIINNMPLADEEKKKIEAAQRLREATRRVNKTTTKGAYFSFIPAPDAESSLPEHIDPDLDSDVVDLDQRGHWEFKNDTVINANYVIDAEEKAAKIREEKRQQEKEQQAYNSNQTQTNTNNSECLVS